MIKKSKRAWRYGVLYGVCALFISSSLYIEHHVQEQQEQVVQVTSKPKTSMTHHENIRFVNMAKNRTNYNQTKNELHVTTSRDTYILEPDTLRVERSELNQPAVFFYELKGTKHIYKIRLNNTLFSALKQQYERENLAAWQPIVTYQK